MLLRYFLLGIVLQMSTPHYRSINPPNKKNTYPGQDAFLLPYPSRGKEIAHLN